MKWDFQKKSEELGPWMYSDKCKIVPNLEFDRDQLRVPSQKIMLGKEQQTDGVQWRISLAWTAFGKLNQTTYS